MIHLQDIKKDATINGIIPGQSVTIIF